MDDAEYIDATDDERLALPRPDCPACGASALIPRIYGEVMPDHPLLERSARGEVDVDFAGCIVPGPPLPFWRCGACGALVASDGARVDDALA